MDGPTYINLEIFGNSEDGGKAGKCLFYLSTLNPLTYYIGNFSIKKSVLLVFQVHCTSILITVLLHLESGFLGTGSAVH